MKGGWFIPVDDCFHTGKLHCSFIVHFTNTELSLFRCHNHGRRIRNSGGFVQLRGCRQLENDSPGEWTVWEGVCSRRQYIESIASAPSVGPFWLPRLMVVGSWRRRMRIIATIQWNWGSLASWNQNSFLSSCRNTSITSLTVRSSSNVPLMMTLLKIFICYSLPLSPDASCYQEMREGQRTFLQSLITQVCAIYRILPRTRFPVWPSWLATPLQQTPASGTTTKTLWSSSIWTSFAISWASGTTLTLTAPSLTYPLVLVLIQIQEDLVKSLWDTMHIESLCILCSVALRNPLHSRRQTPSRFSFSISSHFSFATTIRTKCLSLEWFVLPSPHNRNLLSSL